MPPLESHFLTPFASTRLDGPLCRARDARLKPIEMGRRDADRIGAYTATSEVRTFEFMSPEARVEAGGVAAALRSRCGLAVRCRTGGGHSR
jgi:hypothetical protein